MFKSLTPNLMVEDVNNTVEFYRDVLGFRLNQTVPDSGKYNWASMKSGDVEVMFQTRASLGEDLHVFKDMQIGASLSFFVQVANIDDLHARLKDKVTIVEPMRTTFYGTREFGIADCNGYILLFAENAS